MFKHPDINTKEKQIKLYLCPDDMCIEDIVRRFCDEYHFATIRTISNVFDIESRILFDFIALQKLSDYRIDFYHWNGHDAYISHPCTIKTLIHHDDLISFLISECHLTYTKNHFFTDNQAQPCTHNDICYRKYVPTKSQTFISRTPAEQSEIVQLLKKILSGQTRIQSLEKIQVEPQMFRSSKSYVGPYGDVSIKRLGMIADHLKWQLPLPRKKNMIRLLAGNDHYNSYHRIIQLINHSLLYLKPSC